MSDVAIKVENLSKLYKLGEVGTGTISHDLNRWWHKVRGKEDPYALIGSTNDRTTADDSQYAWALKDVSFEVKKGEVLGIIGRNGAGKSTLLKLLSQITSPTTGSVKAKGRIASLLEVGTGFHPELTGRENIFLNGAILGMTKQEIRSKFDEIVDFSGCAKYVDTPVKRYSSGMMVRLGFAVAAFLEPEILIVDEVLAVGDAEFQKKAIGKMQDVSKEGGRTVLFVSHNMGSIKSLCNRTLILKQGGVIFDGDTEAGIHEYLNQNGSINEKTLPIFTKKNDITKEVQVLEVKVATQEGNIQYSLPHDKPFLIKTKLKLKINYKFYLAVHVLDKSEEIIIFNRYYSNEDISLTQDKYIYNLNFYIPSLLVPDQYSLTIHIVSVSPPKILEGENSVCKFELFDNGSKIAKKGLNWHGKINILPKIEQEYVDKD